MQAFQFIKDIISSDAGSFAFVASIIAFGIWLTHYVTKKVTEINNSHQNIKEENKRVAESIEKISERINVNIDEIRRDIAYLKGVNDIYKSNVDPYAQSHSPISLTTLGKEVAEEIGVSEMIQRNWDAIMNDIDNNAEGKSAYDIQEYCIETSVIELEKFLLPEDMVKLKDYAYNKGRQIVAFSQIFAIMIRDKYMEAKGIPIEEIDKTAPKSN